MNEGRGRGRFRRGAPALQTAVAVAITLVGIGVLAFGARRRAPAMHPGGGAPGLLSNVLLALVVAYAVLATVIALWVLVQRRVGRVGSAPRTSFLRSLLVIALVSALVRLVLRRRGRGGLGFRPLRLSPRPPTLHPRLSGDGATTWGATAGLGLAALVLVGFALTVLRERARRRSAGAGDGDRRHGIAVSIDDLLAQLDAERDPRRAILLADQGMELTLAERGLPRDRTETAGEYLSRVAHDLGLSTVSAAMLTDLYALAHFGTGAPGTADDGAVLTDDDRTRAIRALGDIRDELRLAASDAVGPTDS